MTRPGVGKGQVFRSELKTLEEAVKNQAMFVASLMKCSGALKKIYQNKGFGKWEKVPKQVPAITPGYRSNGSSTDRRSVYAPLPFQQPGSSQEEVEEIGGLL